MFSKTGNVDVSGSTTVSTLVGGIPAGAGYAITLSATTDGTTSCAGSATFNVVAHHVVGRRSPDLPRDAAHRQRPVNGTLNVCPAIDGIGASPAEVLVGGSVGLGARARHGQRALAADLPLDRARACSATLRRQPALHLHGAGHGHADLSVSDGDPAANCADTAR